MRAVLLVLGTSTGCFAQFTGGTTVARGRVTGVSMEYAGGDMALRGTGEVVFERLAKDDGTTTIGAMYGNALRGSLPGALSGALWKNKDWTRWVDVGGDLGYDVGMHGAHGFARAYGGGWLDVRLQPRASRYLTLRLQARSAAYTSGLADETELLFGLGWTVPDYDVHIAD